MVCLVLTAFVLCAWQSVLPLFLAKVLGFDEVEYGWFNAAGQAGAAGGLLLLLPLLQRCLSLKVAMGDEVILIPLYTFENISVVVLHSPYKTGRGHEDDLTAHGYLKTTITLSVGCAVLGGFTGGLSAAGLGSTFWRRWAPANADRPAGKKWLRVINDTI